MRSDKGEDLKARNTSSATAKLKINSPPRRKQIFKMNSSFSSGLD
jgi:hypothetical protein